MNKQVWLLKHFFSVTAFNRMNTSKDCLEQKVALWCMQQMFSNHTLSRIKNSSGVYNSPVESSRLMLLKAQMRL